MAMKNREAVFHKPEWYWASKDNDLRNAYLRMEGRASLADFLAHLQQVASDVPYEEFGINFGTVTWSRPATEEELAERATRLDAARVRHEEWEQKMLVQLMDKYPDAVKRIRRSQ